MILFSQRHKLGELFEEYCKENGLSNCPENMATWLYGLGLLNEEKAKEYLRKERAKRALKEFIMEMTDDEIRQALGAIQKAFEEETENGVPPQNNVFTLEDFLELQSRQKEFSFGTKRNIAKPKWNYHQFKKGKRTK